MIIEELNRKKVFAGLSVIGILFGILGLPLLFQHFYNLDPIKVSFGVIIVYALINWHMKNGEMN